MHIKKEDSREETTYLGEKVDSIQVSCQWPIKITQKYIRQTGSIFFKAFLTICGLRLTN